MYDSYTSDGVNQLYVILRDGFENVPKQAGNNTPYDDYGLSMMTVIVDGDGEMTQSTTRWNHENGSTDSALTPKQVSEITGRNFYQTFKPNHKWRKALEEVERRLAAGESINNVFNYVWNTNDGAIVRVLSKYNFYNWDEERIVSKQWFDQLSEFENASYLIAQQGFTYNLMRPEGGLVLPKWAENIYDADSSVSCFARYDKKWHHFAFYADVLSDIPLDDVWRFSYGWSKVSVNDKYNYMDEDGNLMSEEGFYYVEEFVHEFGKVQRSDKLYNFVNTSGDLVSEQWFIEAVDFNADGYAEVTLEDGTPATLYSDGTIELEGEQHESVRPYKSLLEAVSDSLFSNGKGLSEWRLFGKRKDKQPDTPSNTERPQPKTPPGGEGYPLPQPQNTGYDGKSEPGDTEQVDGDFFLTYGNFPKSLYDLIKQHRYFFNIQFVKTDGSLRTARFSTCSLNSRLVPPNGSMTGRWDRKSRNILTFVDLSKINTKTGKPGVISCRLDNIVYVKCGNKLYDFTKQNRIAERFPYLVRENKRESVLERVVASVLKESQESKSISQAVQLILDRGVKHTKEEAEQFIRKDFREQIPVLRDKNAGKFILGAVRMWLDSQLRDATTISRLNSTLKFVADPTHINEYDRNLNGLSAQELIDRFAPVRQAAQDKEREELNRQQYEENSAYKIIPVNSFEEATKYGKYNDWCLAQPNGKNMYDSYTADGVNQLYVILRDGFERVPKQTGENTPYDDYGLSMMTVIVDPDGDMTQSTTRWNHQNGSSDSALTPKQVSEITGRNFYQTFKPNTKFKDAVAEAERKLKAGMSPEQAFEKAERLTDGFWKVWVGKKCNILDTQNRLLSQKWFDDCWDFFEGFAQVQLDEI